MLRLPFCRTPRHSLWCLRKRETNHQYAILGLQQLWTQMESLTHSDKIWLELMRIGHVAGCHQMESRSFLFHDYQYPLCARCTGITIGYLIGLFLFLVNIRINPGLLLLMCLPCAVDGLVQKFTAYESNNIKRLITGLLIGIAYMQFLLLVIVFAVAKIF